MNKFIEVTKRQSGNKHTINTNYIVSLFPIKINGNNFCGIDTTVENGPYHLSVNESYEEVKKMIGETL